MLLLAVLLSSLCWLHSPLCRLPPYLTSPAILILTHCKKRCISFSCWFYWFPIWALSLSLFTTRLAGHKKINSEQKKRRRENWVEANRRVKNRRGEEDWSNIKNFNNVKNEKMSEKPTNEPRSFVALVCKLDKGILEKLLSITSFSLLSRAPPTKNGNYD